MSLVLVISLSCCSEYSWGAFANGKFHALHLVSLSPLLCLIKSLEQGGVWAVEVEGGGGREEPVWSPAGS